MTTHPMTTHPARLIGSAFRILRRACMARLLPFLLVFVALPATVQALDYTYTTNGGAVTITGYTGPGGAVSIPATIGSLPVIAIGSSAFYNIPNLVSVTIPGSVSSIGDSAFNSCMSLTSVTIQNGVISIGQLAFTYCTGLTSITIPSSVTSISRSAFKNCSGLVIANFEGNAPTLGTSVFSDAASGFTVCYKSGRTGFTSPIWYGYPTVSVGGGSPVLTVAASGISDSSATLNGAVNPNGLATTAQFEYGLTTAYGNTAAVTLSPANGTTVQIVSVPISGLQAEQTYHYRLTITNSGGASQGTDLSFTTGEFPFTYTIDGGAVTITGYNGPGGVLNIPAAINGIPVTRIGDSAFFGKSSLTSVNIPNGITNIGDSAFYACSSLASVSIPASVTSIGNSVEPTVFRSCNALTAITVASGNPAYSSVDGVLFNSSKTTLIQCPRGKTMFNNIPNSVTSIGSWAFSECTGLTSVTIPSGVTSIGSSAFSSCTGLTSASFAGNAPVMGMDVFANAASGFTVYYNNGRTGFTSPTWSGYPAVMLGGQEPPAVTTTAATDMAVTSANLNGTVNPNGAATTARFEYGLTTAYGTTVTVTLSPNNGSTEQAVSASVTGLQSGKIYHYRLTATNNGGTSLGADMTFVTEVFPYTYSTNSGAVTITGYNGVGGVVNIPGTISGLPVTSIGFMAFYNKRLLTSVTIPGSVTNIRQSAFSSCSGLSSMSIPASVTSIESGAFSHCGALTTITVASNNPAYSSQDGVLFNHDRTTLIQCPGGKTGVYSIPATCTNIGYSSFWDCTRLTSVILSGSVTTIGGDAFRNCTGMTSVTIAGGVTSIGSGAFAQCTSLTNVDIPIGVTYIDDSTFSGCSGLRSITVAVGNSAYSSLDGVLFNLPKTTLILYPQGKTGIYSIPGTVTDIGNEAFYACLHLSRVNIPSSVASIGDSAFQYCSGLTNATFAGNAPVMGPSVFGNTASSFTVYYTSGSTGFTSPTWNGYPAVGLGAAPTITTAAASTITATGATLNGTVNPNGANTTAQFEYGLTTAYGNTASVTLAPANGTTLQVVSASISGLQPGRTYHYRLTATNSSGMSQGADMTLVTAPPSVADAIEQPGLAVTHGGTAPWFGQTTITHDGIDAARSGAITHNQESWMQITLTGPGTLTFWWKVSSESDYDFLEFYLDGVLQSGRISGTVDWQQKTYSIAAGTHTARWRYWKDGSESSGADAGWVDQVGLVAGGSSPAVTTAAASGITATCATLNGTVNPNGATTTAQFEYGPTTAYGNTATVTLSPGDGTMAQTVSASISGLQPGQTYHYRLTAANGGGTSPGSDMLFVTAGSPNIFEYAFGSNLPPGRLPLSLRKVNDRLVVETPAQDAATLPFVTVRVLGSTDLIHWTLEMVPAADTTGMSANHAWFEPAGTPPAKAFFRLAAEWK